MKLKCEVPDSYVEMTGIGFKTGKFYTLRQARGLARKHGFFMKAAPFGYRVCSLSGWTQCDLAYRIKK